MLKRLVLALALLAPSAAAIAAGSPPGPRAVVANAIATFIRPTYRQFHADTTALRAGMDTLCHSPGAERLAAARQAFHAVVLSWSAAEIIQFGPITEDNRLERVLFWPDRKGIGLRQVQALLAARDETLTDAKALAGQSIAVQGLTALEFVLYGTGADMLQQSGEASFRCRYGAAIASNLEGIAAAVEMEWADPKGIAAQWTTPGPGNRLYRDDQEMLSGLVDQLVHGLDLVRDVRLRGFLGKTHQEDRPLQALYRRSGNTLASMDANLDAMRRLFEASGIGALLTGDDDNWIPDSVAFEFRNAHETLAAVKLPLEAALDDPAARKAIDHMNLVLDSLTNLIAGKLGKALGLTTGFSSLDGD